MLFKLPREKTKRVKALQHIVEQGRNCRGPYAVEWAINHRYLQGARAFDITSWELGNVQTTFESEDGKLYFRYEDILVQYQRMLGLLMRMELWPHVTAINSLSLNSVRDMAVAQVILDELVSRYAPENFQKPLIEGLLQYGTMGLGCWLSGDIAVGVNAMIESIPPWELTPMPVDPRRSADERGLCRERWMPYLMLRDLKSDWKLPGPEKPELQLSRISLGAQKRQDDAPVGAGGYNISAESADDHASPDDESSLHGRVIESWQYDDAGLRVDEYTVSVGDLEVFRVEYSKSRTEEKPWRPVQIARALHTDSWYGRPWMSPLLPMNMQQEEMLQNLFQNVKDLDLYPMTFIPGSKGIKRSQFETAERPKMFITDEDYTAEDSRIETVAPANTGDAPGRTVAHAQQLADRMSGNSPLFHGDAPGRVESAAGLGVLWETMGIGNIPISDSIANAVAGTYRCMLTAAPDIIGDMAIQLRTVDDRIMGVQVNRDGTVQLDRSSFPQPDRIKIDIRGRNPKMVEERRQSLLLLYDKQLVDPVAFHWLNHAERLDLPTWDEEIVDQIKSCMLRNIIQWGDGETPGAVRVQPFDDHQLMLRVLFRVVRRPAFELASKAVRDAFYERIAEHQAALGQDTPLPLPEEAAAQQAALQGQWGGAAPSGGPLPPQLERLMQQAAAGQPGM